MPAKEGRLPSGGAISASQINTQAGRPATAATSLGDNHMRAFQGNRAPNTPTSLGDARGRQATAERKVAIVIDKVTYYFVKSSGVGSGVSIPTFSLSTEFHPSQMQSGYPLYITSEITEDWWGPLNDPRNINITNLGTNRTVEHGGTGGKKNYYCETKYYNSQSLFLRGWYGGKSTNNRNGRVNVRHLSLLDAGPGKLS
jgi:hypothetical protein